MEYATTILHLHNVAPEAAEEALTTIFANEDRARLLRLEGTYRAVLARAADPQVEAAYRYLICRPHEAAWTPLLELGTRTEGLDVELSRALGGCAVVTTFVYDDGISGYRVARDGTLVDRYTSDPTYFATEEVPAEVIEQQRGHPERFADLLPAGTAPEDFARVVLRPGWWEEHDAAPAEGAEAAEAGEDEGEMVDEVDRMRCIALGLELWGPKEYPFSAELEELENSVVGPAIALAFA
jgi:hypothetical protein